VLYKFIYLLTYLLACMQLGNNSNVYLRLCHFRGCASFPMETANPFLLHSKSNHFLFGSCPTPPQNFPKICSSTWTYSVMDFLWHVAKVICYH